MIQDAADLEPWREAFVGTPHAISYCGKRAIRKNSDSEIYLLTKSQMNGSHAELFTYCLHQRVFGRSDVKSKLKPLTVGEYQSAIGTDIEPGARLELPHKGKRILFEIEFHDPNFTVDVFLSDLKAAPDIQKLLVNECGFREFETHLQKSVHRDRIEQELFALAESIANVQPDVK